MLRRPHKFDCPAARTDNKRPMEVTLAFVADAANMDLSGKLNVLGIFDNVTPREYPYLHAQMFIVVFLKAQPSEVGRKKDIEISLRDPDGQALSTTTVKAVEIQRPPEPGGIIPVRLVMGMANTPFPKPGSYDIAITVNGDYKGGIPITAVSPPKPTRGRRKTR